MVTRKRAAIALLVVAAAWGAWYFFPTRTRQVKRRFKAVSSWMEKDGPESRLVTAAKATKAPDFFAPECRWEAEAYHLSGKFTPNDLERYVFAGRDRLKTLHIRFYDLHVRFPGTRTARVIATVRIEGSDSDGDSLNDTHEIRCVLQKINGKWLFADVTVVQVLKR